MTIQELYWLAGLLEGEGSFTKGSPSTPNKVTISVSSADKDVIERVELIFTTKSQFRPNAGKKVSHYKDIWVAKISGARAVDVMNMLRPYMSIRRQGQIDAAITSYKPTRKPPANLRKITVD